MTFQERIHYFKEELGLTESQIISLSSVYEDWSHVSRNTIDDLVAGFKSQAWA